MDGEGYPTEEELKYCETEQDMDRLVLFVMENWWHHEANKYVEGVLMLHTSGWSGNEDTIRALEKNKKFWEMLIGEKPGGHYYFEVEYHRWMRDVARMVEVGKHD